MRPTIAPRSTSGPSRMAWGKATRKMVKQKPVQWTGRLSYRARWKDLAMTKETYRRMATMTEVTIGCQGFGLGGGEGLQCSA